MRVIIYTDPHWSQYSSIIRSRGKKYSQRLENLISSINWVEQLAMSENCDAVFELGDFFDQPTINAEEISALESLRLSGLPHIYLCGNHEMGINNLMYNTANIFALQLDSTVISEPMRFTYGDTQICFLPYILENLRKPLSEYFTDEFKYKKRIIFSHNNIKGIQFGNIVSEDGFTIDEIEANCDLFINGHLHSGQKLSDKVINLGNFTGQNFSESADKYSHCAMILDTDTLEYQYYENPYAFNFYKLDFVNKSVDEIKELLLNLKSNAVVTITVDEKLVNEVKGICNTCDNIVESRIVFKVVSSDKLDESVNVKIDELTNIDPVDKFRTFILSKLGTSEIVKAELEAISK